METNMARIDGEADARIALLFRNKTISIQSVVQLISKRYYISEEVIPKR
jgi:hypothetical protein